MAEGDERGPQYQFELRARFAMQMQGVFNQWSGVLVIPVSSTNVITASLTYEITNTTGAVYTEFTASLLDSRLQVRSCRFATEIPRWWRLVCSI